MLEVLYCTVTVVESTRTELDGVRLNQAKSLFLAMGTD